MTTPERLSIKNQWLSPEQYAHYDKLLLAQFLRDYDDEVFFYPYSYDAVAVELEDISLEEAVKNQRNSWRLTADQVYIFDAVECKMWLENDDDHDELTEDEERHVHTLLIELEEYISGFVEGTPLVPPRGC